MINTDLCSHLKLLFWRLKTLTWISTHTKKILILIIKTIYTFKLVLTIKSIKLEGVQGLWEKGEKRKKKKASKLGEGDEDISASDNQSISHGCLEMSHHVHVGSLWLHVFHLLVLISTCHLDSWLLSGVLWSAVRAGRGCHINLMPLT